MQLSSENTIFHVDHRMKETLKELQQRNGFLQVQRSRGRGSGGMDSNRTGYNLCGTAWSAGIVADHGQPCSILSAHAIMSGRLNCLRVLLFTTVVRAGTHA